ncbi:MAG: glycosyl transferase family protein [Bryobacterales bacterium]|nr:glycosyl transferase family protein [Bryobacterales bacterium]
MQTVAAWLNSVDSVAGALLVPVAVWILISALDDLFILTVWLLRRPHVKPPPPNQVERPIAIFVPCWHEAPVIGKMLEHNMSAIRYRNYHWFVGAYPNDPETQRAVEAVTARHPNVHLALAPHDGPTSKADCLNWVYQRMQLFEKETGSRFEVVLQHDAEDLVHPRSLEWINYYTRFFAMIQTPVFALPTPVHQFTHGIYCDDFAYSHQVELPVRYILGGFVPSAGVGTAYRRDALEALAQTESNCVFAPQCLTEDYENGYRLHRLGVKQLFIPALFDMDELPLATREFFPQSFYSAYRQRTRWVTGIVFQAWQRHGWGKGKDRYWFWRDRKGVVGNPLGLLANALFLYGCATEAVHLMTGIPFGGQVFGPLLGVAATVGIAQGAARMYCSARLYGWRFAAFGVLRMAPANLLNSLATIEAGRRFLRAKLRNEPLVWVKTEHAYPSIGALQQHKRPLVEILVGAGYLTEEQLQAAASTLPAAKTLEDHLVATGTLSAEDLCEALSLHHHMPAAQLDPAMVRQAVARALPAQIVAEHHVLPVAIEEGVLHVATTAVPTDAVQEEIRRLTSLNPEFVLVPADNFRMLCEHLLEANRRLEMGQERGKAAAAGT